MVKKVRAALERATGGALGTGIGKRTSNVFREISKKGSSVADNVGKTLDRTVSQMTDGAVVSVTGKGSRRYTKLSDDDDIEAGDPATMNRARREEPTAEEDSERLQRDGWCMWGCRKCFSCVEKIAPRRLFGTLERTVEEANAFYRALMYPLRNASKKNRMLMLLMWDLYAALFCTVLFLVMALMSIYTDEHLKSKQAHMSSGGVFDVGFNERVIARFFGIFNFDVACHQGHDLDMCGFWGMWQTQARALACVIAPSLGAHLGAHPEMRVWPYLGVYLSDHLQHRQDDLLALDAPLLHIHHLLDRQAAHPLRPNRIHVVGSRCRAQRDGSKCVSSLDQSGRAWP